jgi:UPF0755 protein
MRKSRVALLIVVTASLVAAAAAALFALSWYRQPLPLPRSPFEFEVRAGAPLTTVARTLREAGVIPHPYALTLLARARGVDRAIKAGSYELESGITLAGLLAKLTQGDVTQTAVTIVEGTTFAEVRRALRTTPEIGRAMSAGVAGHSGPSNNIGSTRGAV